MANMTLAVPKELKKKMDSFPEMNWSEVARQAFRRKTSDLEILKNFTRDREFTEKDAKKLGKEINRKVALHFLNEAKRTNN